MEMPAAGEKVIRNTEGWRTYYAEEMLSAKQWWVNVGTEWHM